MHSSFSPCSKQAFYLKGLPVADPKISNKYSVQFSKANKNPFILAERLIVKIFSNLRSFNPISKVLVVQVSLSFLAKIKAYLLYFHLYTYFCRFDHETWSWSECDYKFTGCFLRNRHFACILF